MYLNWARELLRTSFNWKYVQKAITLHTLPYIHSKGFFIRSAEGLQKNVFIFVTFSSPALGVTFYFDSLLQQYVGGDRDYWLQWIGKKTFFFWKKL